VPLTVDNFVQSNSGEFNAASGSVTLPTGTTAGNALVIIASTYNTTITAPAGLTRDSTDPGAATQKVYIFSAFGAGALPAGSTSWTLTLGTAAPCAWVVYELSGILTDLIVAPVNSVSPHTTATATSVGTGIPATGLYYDVIYIAAHSAYDSTSATAPTWSGHSGPGGDFVETHDQGASGTGVSVGLSTSWSPSNTTSIGSITATSSLASAGPLAATMVGYIAAGSRRLPDILLHWGFEWGTVVGLTTAYSPAASLFSGQTGAPAIVSSTPRSGSYCLELSSTAAAENVVETISATNILVTRVPFRFVGSLPAADVDLFSIEPTVGGLFARYRSGSQKIGVQLGTGAEQLSTATVAADTWYALDIRYNVSAAVFTADWQLDGIDQAQATYTHTGASSFSTVRFGWNTAATATVRYDDIVLTTIKLNYPLGDHSVVLLKVDPAGTLTVSGSTSNFDTFTANGTMANWNATTARGAIDEVPPVVGVSADGFAQTATATADYVEIPMETYTAAPTGVIRAVRMLACGWAASATAATLGIRGWDGVAEQTLMFGTTDPQFDNTSTPAWACVMFKPTGGWTQAKLDALAFRVGFSSDAALDIGIHAIYAEVAVQKTETAALFGESASVYAETQRDPNSQGLIGCTVNTPVERGVTLNWEAGGVPGSQVVAAASSYTQTFSTEDVAYVEVVSENEG
jgi:hypothetical protein